MVACSYDYEKLIRAAVAGDGKGVKMYATPEILALEDSLDKDMRTPTVLCLLAKNALLRKEKVQLFLYFNMTVPWKTISERDNLVKLYEMLVHTHDDNLVLKALHRAMNMGEKQIAPICASARTVHDFVLRLSNKDCFKRVR